MADETERLTELISTPMEGLIVALGRAIGEAQRELDRNSIAIQQTIDEDPALAQYGLSATWYQMPRTELELKVAVAMESTEPDNPGNPRPVNPALALGADLPAKLWLQPVSARYTNQFNYDVSASSLLKLSIVPVPPPVAEETLSSKLSEADVQELAHQHLAKEEDDGTTLRKDARLSINFNTGARMWFVLQYRIIDDEVTILALVKIDDETGQVVKHT